jgi:hypothetical protein
MLLGFTGPIFSPQGACASGNHAIGIGARMIRDGDCDHRHGPGVLPPPGLRRRHVRPHAPCHPRAGQGAVRLRHHPRGGRRAGLHRLHPALRRERQGDPRGASTRRPCTCGRASPSRFQRADFRPDPGGPRLGGPPLPGAGRAAGRGGTAAAGPAGSGARAGPSRAPPVQRRLRQVPRAAAGRGIRRGLVRAAPAGRRLPARRAAHQDPGRPPPG